MCEIHGKKLDRFCLHHEDYFCGKCKSTSHDVQPCECLPVREVYYRLQLEMEEAIQDLVRLRDRGKKIMDGSYQRNLMNRVNDEEVHLDRFYKDMKRKFKETKAKIKAFTTDELSEESMRQSHQFIEKKVPEKIRKQDLPLDMIYQMKNVKKQISQANSLLYGLPNYIEVTIDSTFMNLLTYNADPVVIRGRPKYIPPIESDDEDVSTHNDLEELAYEKDSTPRTMKGISKTSKFINKGAQNRTFDVLSPVQTSAIQWNNNMPAFRTSSTKPAQAAIKTPRPKNKYERQIKDVKEGLNVPRVSLTPQPVKNLRATRLGAKSMSSKPEVDDQGPSPVRKLFMKHQSTVRFVVRERFQLDGCEDAVILQNCIILSLGDKVQKRDKKTMKLVVAIRLSNTANMCVIDGHPTQVAVIQTDKCITVLETASGLAIVYRIKIKQPYTLFCHTSTKDTGPYHPSYVFAAIYKGYPNRPTNCIDIIEAKATRKPGRPPMFDIAADEVNLANHGYEAKEIFGIGGFNDGHIVIGTGDGLICITENGKLVWKTRTPREISGVLCTKSLIYACMQDQKKVMCLNKAGFMTDDNIIPDLDIIPCRLGANWDILLIKDFKTKAWVSIVFKHGLFII